MHKSPGLTEYVHVVDSFSGAEGAQPAQDSIITHPVQPVQEDTCPLISSQNSISTISSDQTSTDSEISMTVGTVF